MRNSKNKNLAAILAFFGGIVGLHRFYLGQRGLGFLMIFFAIVTMGVLSSILGVIDSILFLMMSDEKFDFKYNNSDNPTNQRRRPRYKSYEKRYKSRSYTGENDPSHRRDRRMDRREFREKTRQRTSGGPNRRSRSRKTSRRTSTHLDPRLRKNAVKRINDLKQSGIEKFKDYDIEGSIEDFNQILKIDPRNVAANFNLACAYSQLEKPKKVMHHISVAVESGFDDFDRIRKHEKLAYARIQPEWEEFAKNGFIFDVLIEEESGEPQKPEHNHVSQPDEVVSNREDIQPSEHIDLLEHLNKLKEQREKGVISETEFEIQRRKLMSS